MNNTENIYARQNQATDNVSFRNEHPAAGDSREELVEGLMQKQKIINPKYFYDKHGSQLFDRITRQPEYYPTRTEVEILSKNKQEISAACGSDSVFIEPGSGNCEKVRLLLNDLKPSAYVPIDISADFLLQAAKQLGEEYPWLQIQAVCADFNHSWSFVDELPAGKKIVFYPGSTIGNLEPEEALGFLNRVRHLVGDDGGVLVGVDLHKSSERLTQAYNDAEELTADFNLNILNCVNALLGSNFDPTLFAHRAFYNTAKQRIEMHLVSQKAHTVSFDGKHITFEEGETIHTENSYKYTLKGVSELAANAGLKLNCSWLDDESLFSVLYLSAT